MNRIAAFLAIFVSMAALSVGATGCKKKDAQPPANADKANPNPQKNPAQAGPNQLAAPRWTTKVFDTDRYQLDMPGEPRSEMVGGGTVYRNKPIYAFSARSVTFSDSDLELLTFVLPMPKESYRSLDHVADTFDPILPTQKNETLGKVTDQAKVEVNGKKGVRLTFTAGTSLVWYQMILADKVYVLAAIGSDLPRSKALIDRCFQSMKIDAAQPELSSGDKLGPLTWKRWKGIAEGYEIDMPGQAQAKTVPGQKGAGFERTAAVQPYGTDMEFGVNAIQQLRRGRSVAEYLEDAKLGAPGLFADGKLTGEKKVVMDGQDALELSISTKTEPVVCRVVRAPSGNFGFEIFVSGSKLEDNRDDIDRFFNSFKFTGRSKK